MVSLGLVRVRARVSINIKLFALYLIHRYSVDGATGVVTLGTRIGVPTLGSRTAVKVLIVLQLTQLAGSIF